MNLGDTIHRIRKERKMTLLGLAEKSGVALATLSRMENGKMTGTLESHMKITEALGVTLPDLYKNLSLSKRTIAINTQKSRTEVFIHDKKSSEELLASKVSDKKMMPVLIKIKSGGKTRDEKMKPGIEKFVYVLDGRIEANVGEEKYNLIKGDTLYFEAATPHFFKNTHGHDTKLLCVVSPPVS